LETFTEEASQSLGGPSWLQARRASSFAALADMPLPSEKEEVWRYSPIDELRLDAYRPVVADAAAGLGPAGQAFVDELTAGIAGAVGTVVVHNGSPVRWDVGDVPGTSVVVGSAAATAGALGHPAADALVGSVLSGGDALVRLNDAFVPDAVVVDVAPGAVVEGPLLIVHWCDGAGSGLEGPAAEGEGTVRPAPASFPRTVVRIGRGADAAVVEVVGGAPGHDRALIVPVTEIVVGEGARLAHASLQMVGSGAWHIARLAGRVERDATLRSFTIGLGGGYDRTRTDVAVVGPGGTSELRSAYLGTGSQVHDIRTLQDHEAPRSVSDLLCKGAVAGSARSIYSGLIRVRRGAVKTQAMQTNHNLVLHESAHADSVPNLDIEENDVRCSHASTVGPVDEDQRYYLESRGVPPTRAERLIVLGFFEDIVQRSPVPALIPRLRDEVGNRLARALDDDARAGSVDE
jgi:Fe-S cluster assembly protein SufD